MASDSMYSDGSECTVPFGALVQCRPGEARLCLEVLLLNQQASSLVFAWYSDMGSVVSSRVDVISFHGEGLQSQVNRKLLIWIRSASVAQHCHLVPLGEPRAVQTESNHHVVYMEYCVDLIPNVNQYIVEIFGDTFFAHKDLQLVQIINQRVVPAFQEAATVSAIPLAAAMPSESVLESASQFDEDFWPAVQSEAAGPSMHGNSGFHAASPAVDPTAHSPRRSAVSHFLPRQQSRAPNAAPIREPDSRLPVAQQPFSDAEFADDYEHAAATPSSEATSDYRFGRLSLESLRH